MSTFTAAIGDRKSQTERSASDKLVAIANDEFDRLGIGPLGSDEIAAFDHPDEALDMIDHWQARMGFSPRVAATLISMLNAGE